MNFNQITIVAAVSMSICLVACDPGTPDPAAEPAAVVVAPAPVPAPTPAAIPAPIATPTPAATTAAATAAPATASTAPAPAVASSPEQQTELVELATIHGKAKNDEFTRNVQVVQAQRQAIVQLNEELKSATEDAAMSDLKSRIAAAVASLETNNNEMMKNYGYSILRNYVRVPIKSEIFMVLTDEEVAKQPASTDGTAPAKTAKICVLGDAAANQSFQNTVQKLQQLRQQAAALKDKLDVATDDASKAYAQGQFDLMLKQLNDANSAATQAYMFNLNRQYEMSIEESVIYLYATPEEAAAIRQAK